MRKFKLSFLIQIILLVELVSFLGYFFNVVNTAFFFVLAGLFLLLSLFKPRLAAFVFILEVIIGSKGYLFYLSVGGLLLSIRIVFWLILISVWLSRLLLSIKGVNFFDLKDRIKSIYPLIILFIFVVWGLVNALMRGTEFQNIFFDFNAWLFYLAIFPLISFLKTSKDIQNHIFYVISLGVIWVSIKTLFILLIFSHNIFILTTPVYRWIANTGIGEITFMPGNFTRVFFQSHVFVSIATFIFFFYLIEKNFNIKSILLERSSRFIIFVLCIAVSIIGLSRSNWVGMFISFCFMLVFIYSRHKIKGVLNTIFLWLFASFSSLLLIFIIIIIPLPSFGGGFGIDITDTLKSRIDITKSESALSSRSALWLELKNELKQSWFLGDGFGATLTYQSSDPRITEHTADGKYTTYAFEWGWLDIWLKLGIFGVISYLYLIVFLLRFLYLNRSDVFLTGSIFGLICLTVINFFSPYLNHPLGIMFVVILLLIKYQKEESMV